MENLFQDVLVSLQSYYEGLVVLLPKLIVAIIVFSVLYFLAGRIRKLVQKRLDKQMDDPLLARFLARIARVLIIIIALLIVLQILGLGATAGGLLATAGLGAFVIGFAFKDIGENFLAGIILAFDRPFRIKDVVELDGIEGVVITLNFRTSHLKTFDGKDVYIPNANIIKNKVINYTIDGFIRKNFELRLDYGSDIGRAQKIVLEVLGQVDGIIKAGAKAPAAHLTELENSIMKLTAYYWIDTFDETVSVFKVQTEVLDKSWNALHEAGFYMPGDVIEVKNYKDQAFTSAGS